MIYSNFHTHTTYCDGRNTVKEMAEAAIARGFRALGFSGHSTLFFDDSYAMSEEGTLLYAADVLAAKEAYRGQLEIYLGVEDDLHGHRPRFARDYTIGSAHCIRVGDTYLSVDESEQVMQRNVCAYFGGDYYRYCAAYFEGAADLQQVTQCDFIGHVDLVTKFNQDGRYFDETDPRYLRPALELVEHLCRQGSVFEINTGAISRGYRKEPYPSRALLGAIHDFGGAIVISSDSHSADTLDACFPEAIVWAQSCGFRTCRVLTETGWQEAALDGDSL